MKQGDILTQGTIERKVLGVCGDAVFVSGINEFDVASGAFYTPAELEKDGWRVKESEWRPREGDDVFVLWSDGKIRRENYRNTEEYKFKMSVGNLFQTIEEAAAYRDKLIQLHKEGVI